MVDDLELSGQLEVVDRFVDPKGSWRWKLWCHGPFVINDNGR